VIGVNGNTAVRNIEIIPSDNKKVNIYTYRLYGCHYPLNSCYIVCFLQTKKQYEEISNVHNIRHII